MTICEDKNEYCYCRDIVHDGDESAMLCSNCGAKIVQYFDDDGNTITLYIKDGEMRREVG